jgi:hypothetical protein
MSVDIAFERPDYAYEIRGPELPFFHNTFPRQSQEYQDTR